MTAVREVMSKDLVTTRPSSTLAEAATLMGEHRVGSALVIDGDLVGIFTERDIVRALSQDFDAPTHPVAHWMTRNPKTIEPDARVEEALRMMLDGGFRHLPVVEGTQVVGVVSMRDVSRATSRNT